MIAKMKQCPYCDEEIPGESVQCPYCEELLEEETESTAHAVWQEDVNATAESPYNSTFQAENSHTKGFFEHYFVEITLMRFFDFKGTLTKKQFGFRLLMSFLSYFFLTCIAGLVENVTGNDFLFGIVGLFFIFMLISIIAAIVCWGRNVNEETAINYPTKHTFVDFVVWGSLFASFILIGSTQTEDSADFDSQAIQNLPTQLTIIGNAANEYPDMKFGSDVRWKKYYNDLKEQSKFSLFTGKGTISQSDIDIIFFLTPEGQLIGRYHNHNGINLDFNGYIEEKTGNLNVHLGHKSERSRWIMTPNVSESTTTEFVYDGKWGKKGKISKITIKPYKEENN